MAVTFPDNPVLNESYQAENGLTYVWDGEKWSSQGSYNIDNDNYIRKDGTNTVVYADNLGMGVGTTTPSSELEVVGDTKTTTLNGLAYPTAGTLSNRNLIINGDMSISQRGDVIGHSAANAFSVDRFRLNVVTSGVWDFTQGEGYPEAGFPHSVRLECTTTATSAVSNYVILTSTIEGQDCQYLKYGTPSAESVTVSFWVKSNKTGTFGSELRQNSDTGGAYSVSSEITISSANTWEYKTFTAVPQTGNDIRNSIETGLQLLFWVAAGSQWVTGGESSEWFRSDATGGPEGSAKRAASNFELCDTVGNYIEITGVQVEAGTTATPFEHESFTTNLAKCQRYYQNTSSYSPTRRNTMGAAITSERIGVSVQWFVPMRTEPDVKIYSLQGNEGVVNQYNTSTEIGSGFGPSTPDTGGMQHVTSGTGLTAGAWYRFRWTADAEP